MEYLTEDGSEKSTPLFCVKTTDRRTGQYLYVNFKASASIDEPQIDIQEDALVREICNPTPRIEQFKVPLKLSQVFWRQTGCDNEKSDYVIDVSMSDKFAFRQVIPSEIIRNYVITITMISIEEKFNQANAAKLTHQYIGHKFELDQASYEILETAQMTERSNEPVNNKIILVDRPLEASGSQRMTPTRSDEIATSDKLETNCDLYLRPASMLLTCVLQTDACPNSISFNDDRICIESREKTLLDVFLPVQIDLKTPVKYKFDDRLGLFRIVFKLSDS